MNTIKFTLLAAAVAGTLGLAAAVPSAQASTVNLIPNGNFATGDFTDWLTPNAVQPTISTNAPTGGSGYSAEYTVTSSDETSATESDLVSYAVNLTTGAGATVPGNNVTISWDWNYNLSGGFGDVVAVAFYTGTPLGTNGNEGPGGTQISYFDQLTGAGSSNGWVAESATYAAPSNAESMVFDLGMPPKSLTGSYVTGTLYLTNVSVTSVPAPATLSLVGAGAMGLLLIGRKRKLL